MTDNEKYALTYKMTIKKVLLPLNMNCANKKISNKLVEAMHTLCEVINEVAECNKHKTVFPKGTTALQREIDAGKWDTYIK